MGRIGFKVSSLGTAMGRIMWGYLWILMFLAMFWTGIIYLVSHYFK